MLSLLSRISMQDNDHEEPDPISRWAFWLSLAGVLFLSLIVVILFLGYAIQDPGWLMKIFENHFPATVGLPLAMMAALGIVTLFRRQAGQIEFELLGIRIRGGAGPAIMWIIVFLSMAFAIKLLW